MRRALVVTDETARHPFLASQPPHIRRGIEPIQRTVQKNVSLQDVREFLMAYCACFVAVSAFLI
ncbi:MAG: hypothetical protein ACK564_08320 [Novosphingobium sp.]